MVQNPHREVVEGVENHEKQDIQNKESEVTNGTDIEGISTQGNEEPQEYSKINNLETNTETAMEEEEGEQENEEEEEVFLEPNLTPFL